MLHEEAILLQNQDRHITLPIIYVMPQYIENPRYSPGMSYFSKNPIHFHFPRLCIIMFLSIRNRIKMVTAPVDA